jgi:hypothetical protein
MVWTFFLMMTTVFAGENLQAIRKLQKQIPNFDKSIDDEKIIRFSTQNHLPTVRKVSIEQIMKSGTFQGFVKSGSLIININDNSTKNNSTSFQGLFYNLPDEYGFKYLIGKDGSVIYKIHLDAIEGLTEISEMYEKPLSYTPAPVISKINDDANLSFKPEFSFYAGMVQGNFIKDFFNDSSAYLGQTTQYGFHYFTNWYYPIKLGAVVHYELSTYQLTGGGVAKYSSFSIGPQFKSKDFELFDQTARLQLQYRISSLASLSGETINGSVSEKFNSSDLLFSLEHPVKNQWGEFVFGLFIQRQWLNIRQQSEIVSLRSSTNYNQAFGISLAQVLE